jgi:hypothetical protein
VRELVWSSEREARQAGDCEESVSCVREMALAPEAEAEVYPEEELTA